MTSSTAAYAATVEPKVTMMDGFEKRRTHGSVQSAGTGDASSADQMKFFTLGVQHVMQHAQMIMRVHVPEQHVDTSVFQGADLMKAKTSMAEEIAQAGASDSETEPKEASLFRAERLPAGEEPLTSSTSMEATREAAPGFGENTKSEAVRLEQWEATKKTKGTSAPTGTVGSEAEPKETSLFRAERPSEGEEPRATGTRAADRGTALGKLNITSTDL
jgi:hypothetical protein